MKKKTAKKRTARKKSIRKSQPKNNPDSLSSRLVRDLHSTHKTHNYWFHQGDKVLTDEVKEAVKNSYNQEAKAPVTSKGIDIETRYRSKHHIPELELQEPEGYEIKVGEDTKLTFYNAFGCRTTLTGGEAIRAFDQKKTIESQKETIEQLTKLVHEAEAELKKFKDAHPIPDIPGINKNTPITEAFDLYEKRLKDANNALAVQGSEGNWNANEYLFGMYNGMELIVSIFEGREVKYKEKPLFFTQEDEITRPSPADYVGKFVKGCNAYPEQASAMLQDAIRVLLNKLQTEAEQKSEASAVARKRFEECVEVIHIITPESIKKPSKY